MELLNKFKNLCSNKNYLIFELNKIKLLLLKLKEYNSKMFFF